MDGQARRPTPRTPPGEPLRWELVKSYGSVTGFLGVLA